MIYQTPIPLLQEAIDSEQFTELIAADRMGLLPDSWAQAGTIAAAVWNNLNPKNPKQPEDFRPKVKRIDPKEQRAAAIRVGQRLQKLTWRT